MGESPERIGVVTAFVHSEGKIALVRRSEKVRTYKGCWASFSGYVEQAPLAQAYQELSEEARLSESDLRLEGIGIPLEVDDDQSGARWLVFPFLFGLRENAEIKTDWEADELRWFEHGELSELQAVPGLLSALRRVWPPFGTDELWGDLKKIATDTESGATDLARKALETLGRFIQTNWDDLDRHDLLRTVRALAATRPVMGVFPDLAARLLLGMQSESGEYSLDALITELIGEIEDSTDLSVAAAADALRDVSRLFTLSYSKTVMDAILEWASNDSVVVVAESKPGMEGQLFAENLSKQGICVEILADADITAAVPLVDAVLVGCDSITADRQVLNKVGTHRAVEAANSSGVPSYAIAQSFKIAPPGWPVFLEPQKSEQQGGTIAFDLTSFSSFQAVFTEEGALSEGHLQEIQEELGSVDLIPSTETSS